MVGQGHVLAHLSAAVGGVSVHVALQTVNDALLHGGDRLGERHAGGRGAHGREAVDVHGAVGHADLHALEVSGGLDDLVGLQAAHADVEVEREHVDAVVIFELLAHTLYQIGLADVGVLVDAVVHHGADECFKVDVVVGEVGGVFAGDPVGAVDDLLDVVLIGGELAGVVALDLDRAVGALLDALGDLLHLDRELLVRLKDVAELEHEMIISVVVVSGLIAVAAAGTQCEHHDQRKKHSNKFLQGSSFLLKKSVEFFSVILTALCEKC